MVVIIKSGGYVLRGILMNQQFTVEQTELTQEVVLIVVDTRLVKTIILSSYFQKLQMNGIPPRMVVQDLKNLQVVVIRKYGGYVLKDMTMML